ncbi:hypothetical protein [Streptomyces sp. NPDC087297]|uniref:hypothetical protein n=1 Tax=Streptomyces sp. NPDC087297 TaxID=3365778 RepID=UPI00381AF3C6
MSVLDESGPSHWREGAALSVVRKALGPLGTHGTVEGYGDCEAGRGGVDLADRWSAVIGAASALIGVALTGGFNLLKGRQDFRDKEADRREQRRVMHRTSRRDVYLEALRAYHVADREIQALLKIRPGATAEDSGDPAYEETEAAILVLREACAAVILEGPDAVAEAAHGLWVSCLEVYAMVADVASSHYGSSSRIFMLMTDEQNEFESARHRARGQFIRVASEAIGGTAPNFY